MVFPQVHRYPQRLSHGIQPLPGKRRLNFPNNVVRSSVRTAAEYHKSLFRIKDQVLLVGKGIRPKLSALFYIQIHALCDFLQVFGGMRNQGYSRQNLTISRNVSDPFPGLWQSASAEQESEKYIQATVQENRHLLY